MTTARLFALSALACELATDRRSLGRRLKGLPPDGAGKRGNPLWYLSSVVRHLATPAAPADPADAKKWSAEFRRWRAEMAKLDFEVKVGGLIPKSTVVQREVVIKSSFRRLPRSIAPRLVGKTAREIEAILTERMLDIFRFLAAQL